MQRRGKEVMRKHWAAFLLALLVSIIVAAPQVYFRMEHEELYTEGVQAIEMLPDSPWSPRVREVQDGHPHWGSIYYKEGKDDPYLFQPLGSMIVAYTGMLFGLDINNTILLSRIIFPFLTFLLIYAFVFLISRSIWASLASTIAILLAEHVLSPSGIKGLITGELLKAPINFLEIARPVNSTMIFLLFFGFMVPFFLYYERKKWQWGVLSAIMLGLNFYNYFYSWTYLYAFGGILCVILLLKRKWQDAQSIAYVYLGALIVALPYISNLYHATQYPSYEEVAMRFGIIASHAPLFIGVTSFGALLIFLFGFTRKDIARYIFSLSLLLAPFVTLNQQIITGKVMQAGHYHWYTHKPMAIIFVVLTLFSLLDRWNIAQAYKKIVSLSIITISIAIGITIQAHSYVTTREDADGGQTAVERQKYAPVMHWLNEHAEKDSVVFTNEKISHIIVIYTPLNIFDQAVANAALVATEKRMEDIVFTYFRLRGVDHETMEEAFHERNLFVSTRLYGIYYREKRQSDDENLPLDVLNGVIAKYEKTLSTPSPEWIESIFKKYDIEHVVWDTTADPDWQIESLPFLEEAARFGDVIVYRVK